MSVITPTTPAAIHAPCHNDKEVSFTLVTFLGYPRPEISLELNEQPLNNAVAPIAPSSQKRVRFVGADMVLRIVADVRRRCMASNLP